MATNPGPNVPRGGFTPVGHLNGSFDFKTVRYAKGGSGGTKDTGLIYVGDPVRLSANGQVVRLVAGDVSAVGVPGGFLGIVAGIYTDEAGSPRLVSLPTQSQRISLSSQADYLDVYIDPSIVYAARTAVSAGASFIGQSMNVTTTARVTAAGISGVQLDSTSAVSAGLNPFKVISVSDFQLDTRQGAASGVVHCVVNDQWLKNTITNP